MSRPSFGFGLRALMAGLLAFGAGTSAWSAETIRLTKIGSFPAAPQPDRFDANAAEVVVYDPTSRRAFVVNTQDATIDVLNLQDPTSPERIKSIDVTDHGKLATSVAVRNGLVAVAVENSDKQAPG